MNFQLSVIREAIIPYDLSNEIMFILGFEIDNSFGFNHSNWHGRMNNVSCFFIQQLSYSFNWLSMD